LNFIDFSLFSELQPFEKRVLLETSNPSAACIALSENTVPKARSASTISAVSEMSRNLTGMRMDSHLFGGKTSRCEFTFAEPALRKGTAQPVDDGIIEGSESPQDLEAILSQRLGYAAFERAALS
jgi:hypothetical protein